MAQNLTTQPQPGMTPPSSRDRMWPFWYYQILGGKSEKKLNFVELCRTKNETLNLKKIIFKGRENVCSFLSILHDFLAFWLMNGIQKNSSYHSMLNTKNQKKSSSLRVTWNFPLTADHQSCNVCSGDQHLLQDVDCWRRGLRYKWQNMKRRQSGSHAVALRQCSR